MMRKHVLFIANSLDNAYKFQQVLLGLNAEVSAGSTLQIDRLAATCASIDLVVFEARGTALDNLEAIKSLAEGRSCPLLVIVEERDIENLRLPSRVPADFVMHGASARECKARIRRLMGYQMLEEPNEVITVGSMVVNLATYQVSVAGEPVDFTYLEYALLAFLLQHCDRAYSRDALLQNVWGFDYYGGSRTVDVHVRRIRAKLGPDLSQHLETIRGVGYLWRSGS